MKYFFKYLGYWAKTMFLLIVFCFRFWWDFSLKYEMPEQKNTDSHIGVSLFFWCVVGCLLYSLELEIPAIALILLPITVAYCFVLLAVLDLDF